MGRRIHGTDPLTHWVAEPTAMICRRNGQTNPLHTLQRPLHCWKRLAIFPFPAGMSLTKLSLAVNNLIIPGQGELLVSDIPAGEGKTANLFLQCTLRNYVSYRCPFYVLWLLRFVTFYKMWRLRLDQLGLVTFGVLWGLHRHPFFPVIFKVMSNC
jgi:hypothetical protein